VYLVEASHNRHFDKISILLISSKKIFYGEMALPYYNKSSIFLKKILLKTINFNIKKRS